MTREQWLRGQDQRRVLLSWGSTASFYAALVAGLLLFGLLRVDEVSDYSGPVLVRLGSPVGVDADTSPVESPAATEPAPPVETPPPEAPPAEAPPAEAPKAAEPAPPRPAPAAVPARPVPKPAAAAPTVPAAPPAPPVVKGSEFGNSHETTFESSEGRVARSFYEPIWLYMPLPLRVDGGIWTFMKGSGLRSESENRAIFEAAYAKDGDGWKLRGAVPLAERPRLWILLEESGLDPVTEADYRQRPGLKSVVLKFKVSSAAAGTKLDSVAVAESSGYADIDEAVLYGFREAAFSNASAGAVSGRFVYRFTGSSVR